MNQGGSSPSLTRVGNEFEIGQSKVQSSPRAENGEPARYFHSRVARSSFSWWLAGVSLVVPIPGIRRDYHDHHDHHDSHDSHDYCITWRLTLSTALYACYHESMDGVLLTLSPCNNQTRTRLNFSVSSWNTTTPRAKLFAHPEGPGGKQPMKDASYSLLAPLAPFASAAFPVSPTELLVASR